MAEMDERLTPEEAEAVNTEINALNEAAMQEQVANAERLTTYQEQLAEMESRIAQLAEENEASQQEARLYAEQLADQQEEIRLYHNQQWLEGMAPYMSGPEKECAAYLLDVLTLPPGSEVRAYSLEDEEKKTVELGPAEVFMAMFEARVEEGQPKLYTELSKGGSTDGSGEPAPQSGGSLDMSGSQDPKAVAIGLAKKYSQENKVPLQKAYRIVLDQNPELKEAVAGVRPEGERVASEGRGDMERMYKRR